MSRVSQGIGAERDDGDVRRARVLAIEYPQRFDAADSGQVDVHQYHIGLRSTGGLDAAAAVPWPSEDAGPVGVQ